MGIRKRRDTGVWEFRKTIQGVLYYEAIPTAKSKIDAEIAAADILRKIYEGRYGKGKELGVEDFCKFARDVYLADVKNTHTAPKNIEYKVNALCKEFKGKKLKDISLISVQGLRKKLHTGNSRHGRPRKAVTVKGIINTLSAIMETAIDHELLAKNPCRKLKWSRSQIFSQRERILSEEEEARLMPQLERFYETKAAVILALNTGLRRMGILQRKVSDVNAQKRTLTYVAKGGKKKIIPLNDVAWSVIQELVKEATPAGYLFHARTGHNLSASEGAFKLACQRAKVEDFNFHDLRHTFASRVRSHTDAFTASHLLGHAEIKTTDIYVAEEIDKMREAVQSLGQEKRRVLAFSVTHV